MPADPLQPPVENISPADRERLARIDALRRRLGANLVILGHHYQRPAIVSRADVVGDSFQLARLGAGQEADLMVFCGVRFMAEAAATLARPGQLVFHPDPTAGCPMADMADPDDVVEAFRVLQEVHGAGEALPLVYMNSSTALKGFVGDRGGAVCTSSNAGRALRWALDQGRKVLFLPDRHLGHNTAREFGLSPDSICVYDFLEPQGGVTADQVKRARLILWSGFCHVHRFFDATMVARAREDHPGCRVVVHPECTAQVVDAADASGSTGLIVDFVDRAGPGSITVVGTEANLVERLARSYPDRQVLPLDRSMCPNMYKITPRNLLATLERLAAGDREGAVQVDPRVRDGARAALQRMLDLP